MNYNALLLMLTTCKNALYRMYRYAKAHLFVRVSVMGLIIVIFIKDRHDITFEVYRYFIKANNPKEASPLCLSRVLNLKNSTCLNEKAASCTRSIYSLKVNLLFAVFFLANRNRE